MDKMTKLVIITTTFVFMCSTFIFFKTDPVFSVTEVWLNERDLGEKCISHVFPNGTMSEKKQKDDSDGEKAYQDDKANEEQTAGLMTDAAPVITEDPLVIIYHTHSSESYMPFTESNYHRTEEEGTVRDVGNVIESELKKRGINVIHDKTIHDRPSYNESYNRSLGTIQNLVKEYPSAIYIIDLHRDAAAASATEGKYIEIDGKRVAKFSMVVGRKNENYPELYSFAGKVSSRAGSMYEGFGGAIIEKDYNYNEFVSNRALLLEVGNNKNTIEEARNCGAYFAEVLASIIKDEQ